MSKDSVFTPFLQEAKKYKWLFIFSLILLPISGWLTVKGPDLIGEAIDEAINVANIPLLIKTAWIYLLILALGTIAQTLQSILMQKGGILTLRNLRERVTRHISNIHRADFEKKPLGVFVSRATSDVEAIGETMIQGISDILRDSITIIFILVYIFNENSTLGWITLGLFIFIVIFVDIFRRTLRPLFDNIRTVNGKLSARINEAFSMLTEIKNFNLEAQQAQGFDKDNKKFYKSSIKTVNLESLVYSVIDALLFISIGVTLLFVYYNMTSDSPSTIKVGTFATYIFLLQRLFDPVKQMSGRLAVLQSAVAALKKVHEILSIPTVKDEGQEQIVDSTIHLKELRFSYIEGEEVLKGLNLTVQPSQSLAVVGPTGSGKTTLIKLLTRQYKVEEGMINFGQTALNKVPYSELQKHIVMVPQEPAIFHDSVLFNITLGRKEISKEKVIEICQKIGIERFIKQLSEGYETILKESGSNLSTGQRQLIALARAMCSPAELLIFDEATANIDTETESLIQTAMHKIMAEKTTILIAHRLSTIQHADQIVVLKDGSIIEQGSHSQLLSQNGFYAQLHSSQRH